jgi:hypothetical protein
MRISTRTKSKYLRAADIGDEPLSYTIRNVTEETMQNNGEDKLVVYFREISEGLVLNKTNERRLAEDLGDETAAWTGRRVTLDTIEVDFRGDLVRSIRARGNGQGAPAKPATKAAAMKAARQAQQPLDDLDDEIPF